MKFADFQIITRSHTSARPIADRSTFAAIIADLLAAEFPMPKKVRLVGVSLSSLGEGARDDDPQLTLAL